MNPLLIGPLLDIGKTLIDRFGPEDKAARAQAEAEFLRMAAEGELKQIIAQLEINAREAAHPSVFVAGPRPFIMWVCGSALAYATLFEPIARFVATVVYKYSGTFPVINTDLTLQILFGLLGLGVMRSYEKVKGVASK